MVHLSPSTTHLADANLFILAGTPKRDGAKALISFFARASWTLLVHPDVDTELTDEARKYPRHRTLQRALDEGWAKLAHLPAAPASAADIEAIESAARTCIADRTNRPVEIIEAPDVKLVGLAAERLERGLDADVGLITNDRASGVCFGRVLADFGYEGAEFIDAKEFLDALREWYQAENS